MAIIMKPMMMIISSDEYDNDDDDDDNNNDNGDNVELVAFSITYYNKIIYCYKDDDNNQ